jgi:hypothetical protein
MWLFDWLFPTNKHDRKMCNDKVRFPNEPVALQAIRRINPTGRKDKPNRAYKCPKCHGYHLTKSPKY